MARTKTRARKSGSKRSYPGAFLLWRANGRVISSHELAKSSFGGKPVASHRHKQRLHRGSGLTQPELIDGIISVSRGRGRYHPRPIVQRVGSLARGVRPSDHVFETQQGAGELPAGAENHSGASDKPVRRGASADKQAALLGIHVEARGPRRHLRSNGRPLHPRRSADWSRARRILLTETEFDTLVMTAPLRQGSILRRDRRACAVRVPGPSSRTSRSGAAQAIRVF